MSFFTEKNRILKVRKFISLWVLAAVMILVLTGCGAASGSSKDAGNSQASQAESGDMNIEEADVPLAGEADVEDDSQAASQGQQSETRSAASAGVSLPSAGVSTPAADAENNTPSGAAAPSESAVTDQPADDQGSSEEITEIPDDEWIDLYEDLYSGPAEE